VVKRINEREKARLERDLRKLDDGRPLFLKLRRFCMEIDLGRRLLEIKVARMSAPDKILTTLRAPIDDSPNCMYATVALEDAIIMIAELVEGLNEKTSQPRLGNCEHVKQ
jgi:hypothetical protein